MLLGSASVQHAAAVTSRAGTRAAGLPAARLVLRRAPLRARGKAVLMSGRTYRTYESQMTHLPSHFSQRRPIAMPGCFRHMMRSGWCFAMLVHSHAAETQVVRG